MKSLKRKLLIVEDEESIRFLLRQNMEYEGYDVLEAADGAEGLRLAEESAPDLILLDLMLPKMSGMEVCKRLRATGNAVPIIMLTARGEQMDKVIGLKTGADDYITKPFDVLELGARIEAIFRRLGKSGSSAKGEQQYRVGNAEIDFGSQVIRRNGQQAELSRTESDLLKYLIHNEGKVLPREQIIADVWGHEFLLSSRTIDTHVTYLRKKIEENPSDPQHILTVHRVGYKFVR
jgi:two-component system, OmpR family, alkaline phosphatase synthesis response regulator PhoP